MRSSNPDNRPSPYQLTVGKCDQRLGLRNRTVLCVTAPLVDGTRVFRVAIGNEDTYNLDRMTFSGDYDVNYVEGVAACVEGLMTRERMNSISLRHESGGPGTWGSESELVMEWFVEKDTQAVRMQVITNILKSLLVVC